MRALRRAVARLTGFFTRRSADARLREEIAWHIDTLTDENMRNGMSRHEARRHARLQFGGISEIREQFRGEESIPVLENLLLDLRYTLRSLKRSPAFCLAAFVTLSLAITTNVFLYGILDAAVLRPLAISAPEELYQLRPAQWMTGRLLTTSYPAYLDLAQRNSSFTDLVAYYGYSSADMDWHGSSRRIYGTEASSNYFDALGVAAASGTVFHEQPDGAAGTEASVVISFRLWHDAFGEDPSLLGSSVLLDHHEFRVIGIAPKDFHGTERLVWPDYWVPISEERLLEGGWNYLENRNDASVTVIGRLKHGSSTEQALADLGKIAHQMEGEHPDTDKDLSFRLVRPGLYGDEGAAIHAFLFSVVALTLLVFLAVCFNLATLFSARIADRQHEIGIRVALGVSRNRLMTQLLLEVVAIAVVSGVSGLSIGSILLRCVDQWYPGVGHLHITLDKGLCVVVAAFVFASVTSYGLFPILRVARRSPGETMHQMPRHSSPKTLLPSPREALMTIQMAMCTVLILASLIAMRGLVRTQKAKLGICPHGAYLVHVDPARLDVKTQVGKDSLGHLLSALQIDRSIEAAAAVNRSPMTGGMHGVPVFRTESQDTRLSHAASSPYVFISSPGYLRTAGTRLLAGNDFSPTMDEHHGRVAVVNDTFAHQLWPGRDPLLQEFLLNGQVTRVIGVTETGKYHDLTESPQPVIFIPISQAASSEVVLVVRTALSPEGLSAKVHALLGSSNRDTLVSVTPWEETLDSELFPARTSLIVLGVLGVLACTVAITGVFGVTAYDVSRRTKELALFVALGAARIRVLRAALGRVMCLVLVGTTGGIIGSLAMGRVFNNIVYQARASDPLIAIAAFAAMMALSAVASAIPAKRALSIAPGFLIRQE